MATEISYMPISKQIERERERDRDRDRDRDRVRESERALLPFYKMLSG